MPFSERIKLEVKKKAKFRCCRCQSIWPEIHHIIPEKDGGSDDEDNATPLCPNCHTILGDNPWKRKEIRQMRDWWYQEAETMFFQRADFINIEEKIDGLLSSVMETSKEQTEELTNLKSTLKVYANKIIDNITPSTIRSTTTGILNASLPSLSSRSRSVSSSSTLFPKK